MKPVETTPMSQLYIRAMIVCAVVLSVGFSWLVIAAGTLQPNVVNGLVQLLVIAIIISLLVLVVRRFQRTRQQLIATRQNAEAEANLLRNRSAFMFAATDKLSSKLRDFETATQNLDPNDKHAGPLLKKTGELRNLLTQLETISSLEAHMALSSSATADLAAVLDDVAKQYQPRFDAVGARIQIDAPESIMISADASIAHDIVASIVDNAAKFMPTSGGLLDVDCVVKRHRAILAFTDNGAGIPAEKLTQLFKPFSRTDGVLQFERQGEGLSLYISKLCVEIMGGDITIASKEGTGTTVTVELPLAV